MDFLTKKQRSALMSKIKGKNTKPEIAVRKLVWQLGYRYRLHKRGLPGCPDLVFNRLKKVIFVNGCFWHGHGCLQRFPKTNTDFWKIKIGKNKRRDAANLKKLRRLGWKTLTLWECDIKGAKAQKKILRFLEA